jgi:hypothetical protein
MMELAIYFKILTKGHLAKEHEKIARSRDLIRWLD